MTITIAIRIATTTITITTMTVTITMTTTRKTTSMTIKASPLFFSFLLFCAVFVRLCFSVFCCFV